MATSVTPPPIQDAINQARQAGYSDDEIADHLSATRPGVQTARQAGYSSKEVLDYLGQAPTQPVAPLAPEVNKILTKYGPDLSVPSGGYMGAPSVPFDPEPVIKGTAENVGKIAYGMAKAATLNPAMGASFHRAEPTAQEKQIIGEAPKTVPVPISQGFQPGLMKGLAQGAESLTTPENAAIMAGTGGLGALAEVAGGPAIAQAVNRGLGAYFTFQMAHGATDAVREAYKKHINGDDQGAAQSLGYGSVEAFLAAMGIKHGIESFTSGKPSQAAPKPPRADHPDMYPAAQYGVPRLNAPAGEVGEAQPIEIPKRPEPPKPTKTETVSPATPNPPTAANPTTPENPVTLQTQTEQLTAGKRRVVMYPKGTPGPTSFPQNSAVTADRFGNTYVFRPDLITRSAIKKAAENNTLNEILGDADMGMGVPDKSAIPPDSPTVVTRDAQGNEVHAALTPEENAQTAVEVAKRLMPDGGSVGIEPPSTVIGQRMGEFGGAPPATQVTGPSIYDSLVQKLATGQRVHPTWEDARPLVQSGAIKNGNEFTDWLAAGRPKRFGQAPPATQTLPPVASQPIGAPAGGIPVDPVTTPVSQLPQPTKPGQELFRGSLNYPLNDDGRNDAHQAGKMTGGKMDEIVASTMGRTQETGRIMHQYNPQAAFTSTAVLEPMHLGGIEGTPVTPQTIEWMNDRIRDHGDEPFPGISPSGVPGESFNQFRDRVANHALRQIRDYRPGQRILNVTHYRNIQLFKALLKGGLTSIDMDEMTRKGDQKPGNLFLFNPQKMTLDEVQDASQPGLYWMRHGETLANEGASGGSQKGVNRPEPTDTRGKGQQYHGTSQEIQRLRNDLYDWRNIYGQGFYSTDALDVARGYTKKGKGSSPTIYLVNEKKPSNLYDLDQPLTPEVLRGIKQTGNALADDVLENDKPKTLRELYDAMRAQSAAEGVSADEVQEFFDTVAYQLQQKGYTGLTHVGGNLTKRFAPHRVNIYFNPAEDIDLRKIDEQSGQPQQAQSSYRPWPVASNAQAPTGTRGPVTYGKTTLVRVPGEHTVYPTKFALRELDDVQPSHNGMSLEPNPRYPYQNDHDYSDVSEGHRIVENATEAKYDPVFTVERSATAENGPPVVDQSGHVIGGNSRVGTHQRIFELSPTNVAKYKSALAEHLPGMGIDPSTVANFRKPILVRELLKPLGDNEVKNAITDLNKKGPASLKPEAQAVVDGRRLSDRTLALITGNLNDLGEDGTLRQAITGEKGAEIIMSMVKDGIMPDQEKGQYLEDRGGRSVLTESAKDRIAKALVGRLFSDPKDLKQTPPELRQKLERIAPQLLRVSDRPDWDILPQVRTALGYMADAKAHGAKNLTQLATQEGFDGETRDYEPRALAIAQKLYEGPNKSSSAFRRYANDAELSREGAQASLMEPPTQEEAFRDAFGGEGMLENRDKLPLFPVEDFTPNLSTEQQLERANSVRVPTKHDDKLSAVLVNPAAMEVFGRSVGYPNDKAGTSLGGVYTPPYRLRQLLPRLEANKGAGISALVDAAKDAEVHGKALVIVKSRVGLTPKEIQSNFDEEINHARQGALDPIGATEKHLGETGTWRFLNFPGMKKAIMHLELFYGYDLRNEHKAAAEVGVRLMAPGRYKEMGLTPEEARRLAAKYVTELRRAYGKTAPAEIAKDVFDALRPSRTPQNRSTQPNAVAASAGLRGRGGAATTTGPPVSADSEGQRATVQSTGKAESAGAWTPWSQRVPRQGEQSGLFSDSESAATATDVSRDRDKLTGERLTAQFNSPITRAEQKLKKAKVEQTGLFEEPKPEKAQKGLFESRENWQQAKLAKLSPEANQVWKKLEEVEPLTDLPVTVGELGLPHDVLTKGAQELHRAGLIYGTLHDGTQSVPDDLLIPTGTKSHYGGDGKWINLSRRGEPIKSSSVTLGSGLGPLEPFFKESIQDVKEGLERRRLAKEALERGKATPANKEDGHQILRYTTAEEDWWKARVNQAVEKLKKEVPSTLDQQALTLMRDFTNKPGELRQWANGTHPNYPTDPAAIRNVKRLDPVIKRAMAPSQKMIDANKALTSIAEQSYFEGKRLGILDSSLTPDEYVAHLLQPKGAQEFPEVKQQRRGLGSNLTNYLANAQKRFYPTVLDAAADNVKPATLNALDAFNIYGDRFARRRATQLLKNEIKAANIGFWGGKKDAPKNWVELAPHNNVFKREFVGKNENGEPMVGHASLYVPQWMEHALRPITDPDATQFIKGFKTLQAYQGYIKAAQLSLSLFHLYTENAVSLADVGPVGRWKIANADRFSPEFQEAELHAIKAGMKTTVVDHARDAWRRLDPGPIPTLGDLWKRLPVIKQADELGNAIGEYTFNNFIRKAKVFSFTSRSTEWRAKHPQASQEEIMKAEQGIAKYVNGAYGGLHFENMGWGKTGQNLARIVMMAPDWVFSNYVLGKYAATDWKSPAGHLSRMFFLRTLIYGAIGSSVLSYLFTHKWQKDFTRVHFGQDEDGKDVVSNLAFRAAAGDMVSLAHNVAQYGAVAGIGKTFANKGAAIPRAALHVMTNSTGQGGQEIATRGMSPIASTARGLKTIATDISPVPFAASNALKASEENRKWWEYLITVLTGQPPQHVKPDGMHKHRGEYVPDKPKPEGSENSIWDQIRTGKVYKSKKEMRDLATPAPY